MMKKTFVKTMRLDPEELDCIMAEAERRNMTFSDFMRKAARSFFADSTHSSMQTTHAPVALVDTRAEYQAGEQG